MLRRFALLTLLVLPGGCADAFGPEPEWIAGTWLWTSSGGGIVPQTLTPESEGYTLRLIFEPAGADALPLVAPVWGQYQEFRNDSLVRRATYTIELHGEVQGEPSTFVRIGRSLVIYHVIMTQPDELTLLETCADCFAHRFVRLD